MDIMFDRICEISLLESFKFLPVYVLFDSFEDIVLYTGSLQKKLFAKLGLSLL